jgi:hypothetical protein
MKYLTWIKDHLRYFAESYLGLPMAFAFIWLTLYYFRSVEQRAFPDQPDQLVAMAYNAFGALMVLAITGFAQWRNFGYRNKNTEKPAPLCDDIYDSVITFSLLVFFSYLVFHK